MRESSPLNTGINEINDNKPLSTPEGDTSSDRDDENRNSREETSATPVTKVDGSSITTVSTGDSMRQLGDMAGSKGSELAGEDGFTEEERAMVIKGAVARKLKLFKLGLCNEVLKCMLEFNFEETIIIAQAICIRITCNIHYTLYTSC